MQTAITVACLLVLAVPGVSRADDQLTTICEDVVKARLLSPSGYARINVGMSDTPIGADEYRDLELMTFNEAPSEDRAALVAALDERVAQVRAGSLTPTSRTRVIEFDAPNAFNVLLRNKVVCRYDDDGTGFDPLKARLRLTIDGVTEAAYRLFREANQ